MIARLAAALGALVLVGCATLAAPTDDCERWFAALDAEVDAAGVRDAQDERVAGFAGLRIDRLAEALRERAAASDAVFAAWLDRAMRLDREAREAELANLGRADAAAARDQARACRARWPARLAADAALRQRLLALARVPDRYALGQRALGLYPVLRWPFYAGVRQWQSRQREAVARWAESPPPALTRWRSADESDPSAPVFEIEERGGFDRFGAPQWRGADSTPQIDTAQPAVYRRRAQALVGGRIVEQRVYSLWFPERPADGPFDLLAGALDGVIVRITPAADGRPLVVDTIHACGCWHQFFVAPGVKARAHDAPDEEGAFVAGAIDPPGPGERLVIRIASATHQVMGVGRIAARGDGARYALRDDDDLRSLPRPDGTRASLYRPDGRVAGSERAERWLFWPMGIASAGAMRQWGHHATAFVGRRHFDDPRLIERALELADNLPHFSPVEGSLR